MKKAWKPPPKANPFWNPPKAEKKVKAGKRRVKSFYASEEWKKVRYQALKKWGGCCQCCGARASRGKPLHVDHIKSRLRYPSLALELSNLQVLCKDCNEGKGWNDMTDWRPSEYEAFEERMTRN